MVNRRIVLIRIVSVAAMVVAAGIIGLVEAAHQDRPGTPGDVAVWHCSKQEQTPPKICVSFRNTATEPVGFWFEWTRNGEKLPSTLKGYDAFCRAGVYNCDAVAWFGGPSRYQPKRTSEREWPMGFTLQELDYDTEFCFRFKAVNEDGVVSENWSKWVCANTGPVPVIPAAPKIPLVTLMQATSGRRTVGEGTPAKLLVEWEKVASDTVGWYEIEREYNLGTGNVLPETTTRHEADKPTEVVLTLSTEQAVTPDSKFRVRVCAVNPAMRKCSPWGANLVVTSTLPEARDETSRTTLPSPGSGRFEPGKPTSREGAGAGPERGSPRTSVPQAEPPPTLGKRKRPDDDDTAGRTLGKRRRPDTDAAAARPNVDPAVYDAYVGRYSVSPSHIITISRDGDQLLARQLEASRPDQTLELMPESQVKFGTVPPGITVWFAKDATGRVASIKIVYPNRELRAVRMPN
jgi:hypothetical protein